MTGRHSPGDPAVQAELARLGQRIRRAREKQGWSLRTLADYAGVGLQTLVRIERGSSGSSLENVTRVLHALELTAPLEVPVADEAHPSHPSHLLHVDASGAAQALERAARAACQALDAWLASATPEQAGLCSDFQDLLRAHLAAMLAGEPAARHGPNLPRLVYSDSWLGGPPQAGVASCDGWVLRVRGTPLVLQGARTWLLAGPGVEPYPSRNAAERGFRAYIDAGLCPQGPVDAVPVFFEPARGRYRF